MRRMAMVLALAGLVAGAEAAGGNKGSFAREFRGVTRFEMDSGFIPATLVGAPGSILRVEAYDLPEGLDVVLEQEGDRVVLRIERGLALWIGKVDARFNIIVPATADCELSSTSGSISARDLGGEVVRIKTGSGAVECASMEAPLDIDSASGEVSLRDSDSGAVLKTASGSIRLEKTRGDAVLSTLSGSIGLSDVEGAVKASSSSGKVSVRRFAGRLYVRTVSGSVETGSVSLTGESLFETVSGSLELSLDNERDDFHIKAETHSGSIKLFGARIGRGYEGGSGAFPLTLTSVSGSIRVE